MSLNLVLFIILALTALATATFFAGFLVLFVIEMVV